MTYNYSYSKDKASSIVYYNATLTNELQTTYNTIPASFNQVLDQELISDPKFYDLAITRFNISSQCIPMWICPIQINQPDINLTPYAVQLSYTSPTNNTIATGDIYLIWISDIQPPPYYGGLNIKSQNIDTGYYFSYNRQDFVDIFNNAI